MINTIYNTIEDIFSWINKCTRRSVYEYCDLESADDENTLITKDGSLTSVIEIDGINQMIGEREYHYLCEQITMMLTPLLQKKGIRIKCTFRYDGGRTSSELNSLLASSQQTAKRLDIDLDDYFNHRQGKLEKICVFEKCYLNIWTSPAVLSAHAQKKAYKSKAIKFKYHKLKVAANTQHFLHVIDGVRQQHKAVLTTLLDSLNGLGITAKCIEILPLLNQIKQQLNPDSTHEKWQAALPGDKLYYNASLTDAESWLWPSLSYQLFSDDGENVNMSESIFGNYRYSACTISLFPKQIQSFYTLFKILAEYNIPWQITYSLSANGIKISQSKSLLAQFLTFSSHENKLICQAHKLLKNINDSSDMPIITLSVNVITWAHKGDLSLFHARKTSLNKAIQSWGGAQTTDNFGDPFKVIQSSMLCVNQNGFTHAVGAPLTDAIKLMPFFRPATSWNFGATLFRTPDGKIWPYQSGSSKQVSWIELIYARSGSGKSVLLNALNLSSCIGQGLEDLPFISILDVGSSSKGLIELIQASAKNRNVAAHYHFTLSNEHAINPFDTHLGARSPSYAHKFFLVNFISTLMIEIIDTSLPDAVEAMISLVIDELYRVNSDNESPKIYQAGLNEEIDHTLIADDFNTTNQTWWAISDWLFAHQKFSLAKQAQRFAMPVLSDLIYAINLNSITDLYQSLKLSNGENYIQYFCRNIATTIKNFPSLNMVTKLDVNAKIVAFDLASVMNSVSSSDVRISVLSYMLVRHLTSSYFFISAQDIDNLPNIYQLYHKKQLQMMHNIPKRIVFDEFHRMQGCKPILKQVLTDMREGRKQNVQIALASQSLDDFNHVMLEFATSIFILSSGNQSALDKTQKHFGLNETETLALKHSVHGPGAHGMNFVGQFHTVNGINTALLNLNLSAYEIWMYTTTAEDCYLKEILVNYIGLLPALNILTKHFPSGSAKPYLESQANLLSHKTIKQLSSELAKSLIQQYQGKPTHA